MVAGEIMEGWDDVEDFDDYGRREVVVRAEAGWRIVDG
jgi:hypothetical protein